MKTIKIASRVKSLDKEKNKVTAVISTIDTDRDGEIVDIQSLDIEEYKQNPILLVDHTNSAEKSIGKALRIWKSEDETTLYAEFEFARKESKLANDLFLLFQAGVLKSFSIGFVVGEVNVSNGQRILSNCKLHEVSVVAVPANSNAIAVAVEKKLITKYEADTIEISELSRVEKALVFFAENREILKKYRKQVKLLRKSLGIDPMESEAETLEKVFGQLKKNLNIEDNSNTRLDSTNQEIAVSSEELVGDILKMLK